MLKTGMYVLQGIVPAEVAVAPFDVKVIDVYNDSGRLFSAAEVAQMGGGPGGGLLLGYFSIGEAEVYRDYFKTIPQSAIGPENPDWQGNFEVAYWTAEWRAVATSYLDRMIAAGYDGIYFDVVDEYQQAWARRNAPGGDAEGAMVDLVKYLADYAHARNPDFKIWANNAEELLANSAYLDTIDGMFKENLFYQDNGSVQPSSETSYSLGLLNRMLAAGKDVIAIEYVSTTAKISDVQAKAAAAGVGSYTANLDLDGISYTGVLPGQAVQPEDPAAPSTPPATVGDAGADPLDGTSDTDLDGTSDTDTLDDGTSDGTLDGAAGTDTPDGIAGADTLDGGTEDEPFTHFTFNGMETDRISLKALDADLGLAGDQAFTYVGDAAFSGSAGELSVQSVGGGVYVASGDMNGDAVADFAMTIQSATTPTEAWFIL